MSSFISSSLISKVLLKILYSLILLIGAVLVVIGFVTPFAYFADYSGLIYMWMGGLNIFEVSGYGLDIVWTRNPELLIPAILFSVLIFICVLVLFGSVSVYKKSTIDGRETGYAPLTASIVIIACTIGWIVTLEIVWEGYPDFWDYMDPHFGVFGLFIGSGISIAGYTLSRYTRTQRSFVIVPKKHIIRQLHLIKRKTNLNSVQNAEVR